MQDRGGGRNGRGRGRGGIAPGMRPVSEESRISIADQMEKFRESTDSGMVVEVASACRNFAFALHALNSTVAPNET